MASILNNVTALGAARQLGVTNMGLQKTIERLTTGKRINRAADDAAGLAIASKLGADIRVASQGRRNANDAISYLQVADGVTEEITSLLTRAAELAEQAASGTSGADGGTGKTALNDEFAKILTTIDSINTNTKFNGQTIFGTTLTVAMGDFAQSSFSIDSVSATTLGVNGQTITTADGANTALGLVKTAIDRLSASRGEFGAEQQRLQSISNSLGIQVENFTAAFSQIRDADIADEVVNLTKFQVLGQSGTSALAQSNAASQNILALLR